MATNNQYLTESYLRRQIEVGKIFANIWQIFGDLAFDKGKVNYGGLNSNSWFNSGELLLGAVPTYQPYGEHVMAFKINDRFYEPNGTVIRGKAQNSKQSIGTTGQFSKIRDDGENPIVHNVSKTVTLENSTESHLTKEIQLDMTAKVEGGYGGVSASLETHLGLKASSESIESQSTTTQTTFSDEVTISPDEEVAIVYSRSNTHFSQPFIIDAIVDVSFTVDLFDLRRGKGSKVNNLIAHSNAGLFSVIDHGHWANDPHDNSGADSHYQFPFDNIKEFCGFIRGFDVRAPGMSGYINSMSSDASTALAALEDEATRHLSLSGYDSVSQQGDADYSVEDIMGINDDQVEKMFGTSGNALPEPSQRDLGVFITRQSVAGIGSVNSVRHPQHKLRQAS